MYSIRSPEVFVDPYYQKIRGMGPWLSLIDKRFYQRNLFEGVEQTSIMAPEVPAGFVLAATDQVQPELWPIVAQYFKMEVGQPNSSTFAKFASDRDAIWHAMIKNMA